MSGHYTSIYQIYQGKNTDLVTEGRSSDDPYITHVDVIIDIYSTFTSTSFLRSFIRNMDELKIMASESPPSDRDYMMPMPLNWVVI